MPYKLIIVVFAWLAVSCGPASYRMDRGTGLPRLKPEKELDRTAPLGSFSNPVKCQGPPGEREYLTRLICTDREGPDFERAGSVGVGPYGNILDLYEVRCSDQTDTVYSVYMDMYHEGYTEDRPIPGFEIRESTHWQRHMESADQDIEVGDLDKALESLDKALAETEKMSSKDERKGVTLQLKTNILYRLERYQEAKDGIKQAMEFESYAFGEETRDYAYSCIILALINVQLKDESFDYLIPAVYGFHKSNQDAGIGSSRLFQSYLRTLRDNGMTAIEGRLKVMFDVM
jgi:hypothetical protein